MGILDIFKKTDMNQAVETCRNTPGAVLIDVRSPAEFAGGHIPGSINLPIQALQRSEDQLGDPDAPIYVYCQSGARSSRAARLLEVMGYSQVTDLGGIGGYSGELEK